MSEVRELSGEEVDLINRSAKKVKAVDTEKDVGMGEASIQAPKRSFRDAMISANTPGLDRHDEFGSMESDEGLIHIFSMENWPKISLSDRFKTQIRRR